MKLKTTVPLALLGILPDLDALLLIHRSYSHSLVVLGLLFIPKFLIVRRYTPAHQRTVVLGYLVVASHIFLDLGGATPVLWPIYPYDLSIKFSLNVIVSNGARVFILS